MRKATDYETPKLIADSEIKLFSWKEQKMVLILFKFKF